MMRDYANTDLNDECARYVQPAVFRFLLDDMGHKDFHHSWRVDPGYGITEIAHGASRFLDSYPYEFDLLTKHFRPKTGDAVQDELVMQARGYIHAVYLAITWIAEVGLVEFEMSNGWPYLRLTRESFTFDRSAMSDGMRAIRDRIDELRAMPYPNYLQTEEWRRRRLAHIEAAGGRCQLCNSDAQPLHVHHRTYENRGRENFYDLVALCGPCHEWFHKSGRKVR